MKFARAARLFFACMLVAPAGSAGTAVRSGAADPHSVWESVSWPFLLDEWGTGRAFRCERERCGADQRLFMRMKRGFCNCLQGVADDAEVDRLTDFAFFGAPSRPLGSGRAVTLGDMSGRMRAFALENAEAPFRRAVSLVVAKDCEALVVTLISRDATSTAPDAKIPEFLPRTALADLP